MSFVSGVSLELVCMLAILILHTAQVEVNLLEIGRKVLQISEQRWESGSLTLPYVSHAPFSVTVS